MDEGLAAYAVRGKGSPSKVEELITYFVVTCNDEASGDAAKYVTYREVQRASFVFFWRLGGGHHNAHTKS